MAEMETQYTNQFQKLSQELEAVSKRANHAERKLKEKESQFQAQLSQSSYITGEKKKLEVSSKSLENGFAESAMLDVMDHGTV